MKKPRKAVCLSNLQVALLHIVARCADLSHMCQRDELVCLSVCKSDSGQRADTWAASNEDQLIRLYNTGVFQITLDVFCGLQGINLSLWRGSGAGLLHQALECMLTDYTLIDQAVFRCQNS